MTCDVTCDMTLWTSPTQLATSTLPDKLTGTVLYNVHNVHSVHILVRSGWLLTVQCTLPLTTVHWPVSQPLTLILPALFNLVHTMAGVGFIC